MVKADGGNPPSASIFQKGGNNVEELNKDEQMLKRAAALLRRELGPDWKRIVQLLGTEDLRTRVGKRLTSFVAYPDRGEGGSNKWRGNASPLLVRDLVNHVLECKRYSRQPTDKIKLLDPMSGSGSSKAAADKLGVESALYDLNPAPAHGRGGWNALVDDVVDDADFIFFHPPYHNIIPYSGRQWGSTPHPDDLSHCDSYPDFRDKLNYIIKKLYMALRRDGRMAILVGDIRCDSYFYSIQNDIMTLGRLEAFITKAQYNCKSDTRRYKKPFIPIVTEYLVLLKKEGGLLVPFTRRISGTFNMLHHDNSAVTWNHLIRNVMEELGGTASTDQLYSLLANHPKAQGKKYYRDRIRAVIQEYPQTYRPVSTGVYELAYAC